MSPKEFVNTVKIAQENLEEANRQLAQATLDLNAGRITEDRFRQLKELKDTCTGDLARVIREN